MIKITLQSGDNTQEVQGRSVLSAVKKLKKPDNIKTMSLITVEAEEKRLERRYTIPKINKLFGTNELYKEVFAKNLSLLLK